MPSTISTSVSSVLPSSMVMTPVRPTLSIARAIMRPTSLSLFDAMVPTAAMSAVSSMALLRLCSSSMTAAAAFCMPRFSAVASQPATTRFMPSRQSASPRTVAVVVPSPASSPVLVAACLRSWAPMFS